MGHYRADWQQIQSNAISTLIFRPALDVIVNLGMTNLSQYDCNEQKRRISKTINHPRYNSNTKNNDIALLQLNAPVTFTNFVMPVCLAATNSDFPPKTKVWVTGWGDIHYNGERSTASELCI